VAYHTTTSRDSDLAEIYSTPLLTQEEEHALATRVAAGDAGARDHLARANLRLVVHIARDYAGKGLALDDLIAEGNLGLMRAVEGFDPGAGTRFSTYAAYWVKQSMRVALNKTGHAVRLPQYVGTMMGAWRVAETELQDELGRGPSRAEVDGRLGLSARMARIVEQAQKASMSGGHVGGDMDLGEFDVAGLTPAPDAGATAADDLRVALGAMDGLGGRDAMVLRMRFGLDGGEPATLREIGEKLGLTRERVRQIERGALDTLREQLSA
jgi:RNA polymerase primary sigma factor